MKIVVIGGTGLIGSKLVAKLIEHRHQALAAAPNTGVNTLTGEGLTEVMEGADVVIDVANSPSFEATAVMDFFKTSTRNVIAAESEAGVRHHVALSIVGTERMPENSYFAAKLAQEELVRRSGISYSVVHATQFYEFVPAIADAGTVGSSVHIAAVAWRPIAGDDVATNVARTAVGKPLNGRIEVAGPQEYRMDEFFRMALAARRDPREVVTDPHAQYFGSELSERSLVPIGEAIFGEIHYDDWFASNNPTGGAMNEKEFLHTLEVDVKTRLDIVDSTLTEAEAEVASPPAEWLFDPTEVVEEDVALRSLLGAVKSLEADSSVTRPDQ
ncbi:hypothetical protein GCM10027053_23370 [Intrasporangium mesophilum]